MPRDPNPKRGEGAPLNTECRVAWHQFTVFCLLREKSCSKSLRKPEHFLARVGPGHLLLSALDRHRDCPHEYRLGWLKGEVWIDMSKEQVFSHILVKTKIGMRLSQLAEEGQLGPYLSDGLLLSNFAADISGNPDGTFLSYETLRSDRVRLIEGKRGGFTEIQGSPDMVLEVVSDSSVQKDEELLRRAYWEAEIREYWMVDAREIDPPV